MGIVRPQTCEKEKVVLSKFHFLTGYPEAQRRKLDPSERHHNKIAGKVAITRLETMSL
jgi:hypothetical protein